MDRLYEQPVLVEVLLFKPRHGLIDQSLHARMGVETTNGDAFGLDWYGAGEAPGLYRAIAPAWGDENLHELAAQIESPVVVTPHDEPHRAHHSPGGHTRGSRAARPRPKQGVCGGRRTVLPATAAGT